MPKKQKATAISTSRNVEILITHEDSCCPWESDGTQFGAADPTKRYGEPLAGLLSSKGKALANTLLKNGFGLVVWYRVLQKMTLTQLDELVNNKYKRRCNKPEYVEKIAWSMVCYCTVDFPKPDLINEPVFPPNKNYYLQASNVIQEQYSWSILPRVVVTAEQIKQGTPRLSDKLHTLKEDKPWWMETYSLDPKKPQLDDTDDEHAQELFGSLTAVKHVYKTAPRQSVEVNNLCTSWHTPKSAISDKQPYYAHEVVDQFTSVVIPFGTAITVDEGAVVTLLSGTYWYTAEERMNEGEDEDEIVEYTVVVQGLCICTFLCQTTLHGGFPDESEQPDPPEHLMYAHLMVPFFDTEEDEMEEDEY
eukprot:TRINITY_DN95622_c0_g1_i1.p1 TRINITY_DN95622_c0_g1~~TRINITY_DN95622_c0_g1_i1.p1  ORF type:complete len:362 (-),score=37.19 TRINITY_DN95622_c0_g1_i1:105-1190(-)